jgi:hypothetical protein
MVGFSALQLKEHQQAGLHPGARSDLFAPRPLKIRLVA